MREPCKHYYTSSCERRVSHGAGIKNPASVSLLDQSPWSYGLPVAYLSPPTRTKKSFSEPSKPLQRTRTILVCLLRCLRCAYNVRRAYWEEIANVPDGVTDSVEGMRPGRRTWLAVRPACYGGGFALGCCLCAGRRARLEKSSSVVHAASNKKIIGNKWARYEVRTLAMIYRAPQSIAEHARTNNEQI